MLRLLADASLPALEVAFPARFALTYYHDTRELAEKLPEADILLCRSSLTVDNALLKHATLKVLATASSGSNHIDRSALTARGIHLIDAKGCNAVSVADYVVASLAHLAHRLGLRPKTAAIIGVGEVGTRVEARLRALNMDVFLIDPPRATREPDFKSASMDVLSACDLICLHADLHDTRPFPTRGLLHADLLSRLKPGTILLNAARGELVDEQALPATQLHYCTDVWHHEPDIDAATVAFSTLCTPHIAGHSIEGKTNAVWFASERLHRHFGLVPPAPAHRHPAGTATAVPGDNGWEAHALHLYDPETETQALKIAEDKKAAFLRLRKAHVTRHDFAQADKQGIDLPARLILGMG